MRLQITDIGVNVASCYIPEKVSKNFNNWQQLIDDRILTRTIEKVLKSQNRL